MKTYAFIQNGVVFELWKPATRLQDSPAGVTPAYKVGDEIPIADRLTPAHVAQLTDVTNAKPMPAVGWTTQDGVHFQAPAVFNLTAAKNRVNNQVEQGRLLAHAGLICHPANEGMPHISPAAMKAWNDYRTQLAAVDLDKPVWPVVPTIPLKATED